MSANETYFVWSNEHHAWWKPGGWGYCNGLRDAGYFTREQALEICRNALPTAAQIGRISEIPVRSDDLLAMLRDQIVPEAVYQSKNK